MTRKQLRLFSYVRVSDVRGREGPGFISPNEQREKCRAFATAMSHTIVDEVEELDRSGGDMTRPVFNALLERIEAGEADGMIVAKLNRFARSNVGAWQALGLSSGWTNFGAPYSGLSARRSSQGIVYMRGVVATPSGGGTGLIITTLPVNMRPQVQQMIVVWSSTQAGR